MPGGWSRKGAIVKTPELLWLVPQGMAGIRLDKFLADAARLGSRERATDAVGKGKVFVNDREAGPDDAARQLRAGDAVRVWADRPGSARGRGARTAGDLQILYEDSALIVVNKPAGLLAVPLQQRRKAPSVYGHLEEHLRSRTRHRPLVVHRIDRDTSGIVVFAKHARVQEQLKAQFERREPERVYWAVVHGHPRPPQGTWRDDVVWDSKRLLQLRAHPHDARKKEAVSHYRVVDTFRGASLVEIRLETGKRNQIRLQARLHGHPIVGERVYAGTDASRTAIAFSRQALHACRLSFQHPVDGRPLTFEAPLPADMGELLAQLRAISAPGAPSPRPTRP
jgi:23S rRNA pseudouridine1911/1915/1917 synthase